MNWTQPPPDRTLWRACAFADYQVANYGEECVVFDAGSGGTHVMDPVAAFVLSLLTRNPMSFGDLREGIIEEFAVADDVSLAEYLDVLLRELRRKSLIQPIDA